MWELLIKSQFWKPAAGVNKAMARFDVCGVVAIGEDVMEGPHAVAHA